MTRIKLNQLSPGIRAKIKKQFKADAQKQPGLLRRAALNPPMHHNLITRAELARVNDAPAGAWHSNFKVAPKARRINADGEKFDSRAEMVRFNQLRTLERGGVIKDLKRQQEFPLVLPGGVPVRTPTGRTMKIRVDFTYLERHKDGPWNWQLTWEEAKPGFYDPRSELKIAVAEAIYGNDIFGGKIKVSGKGNKRPRTRRK